MEGANLLVVDPALADPLAFLALSTAGVGHPLPTSGASESGAPPSNPLGPSESFDTLYSTWINPNPASQPQQPLPAATGTRNPDVLDAARLHHPHHPGPGNLTSDGLSLVDVNLIASFLAAHPPPAGPSDAGLPPAAASLGAYAHDRTQLADFLAAVQDASSSPPPPPPTTADAFGDSFVFPPAPPPFQGSTPKSPVAASTAGAGGAARPPPIQTPRPPQADSTVPEAALHLLRLALPSGPGTATTVSSGEGREGEEDASCDEDAEGEVESDNTSLLSESDSAFKAPSLAGSVTGRAHRPARAMKAKAKAAAAAAAAVGQGGSRRTSGRVRKTILQSRALVDSDEESEHDDDDDEAFSDMDGDAYVSSNGKGKGRAKGTSRAFSREASSTTSSSKARRASSSSSSTKVDPKLASKRSLGGSTTPLPLPKKARVTVSPQAPRRPRRVAAPVTVPFRTFPATVQMDTATFPRMYRTFPVSSAFPPDSYVHRLRALPDAPASNVVFMQPPADAKWNKASDPFNLYAPKFVKGLGDEKCGMCPICAESVERGGEGVERWLKLKNSSFVYHMSYAHGLSNLTGLPFSPPVQLRTIPVHAPTKDARDHMTEGLCHKCNEWIPLLSVKNVEAVVPELIWWKHAKPCHASSAIQGEGDYYLLDDVYQLVLTRNNNHNNQHNTNYATSAGGQATVIAPAQIDPSQIVFQQYPEASGST